MSEILNNSNHQRFNPVNERIVYRYLAHRQATDGNDDKTLDSLHKAIRSYEILTDFVDFKNYSPELGRVFIGKLRTMELSESYLLRLSLDVREFLRWYSRESDGRAIKENDLDYIKLKKNELRAARASGYQPAHNYVTLFKIVNSMPCNNIINRRNRALYALAVLGSFRSGELRNITLGSLICDNGTYFIDINPRKIKGVKFCKERQATLINRNDLLKYVLNWVEELRNHELFTDSDPMFPAINSRFTTQNLFGTTIVKTSLGTNTISDIFKRACAAAGVPYIKTHNMRHTKARYFNKLHRPELMAAVQQDFGHKKIDTTMNSYVGAMPHEQQRELIASIDFNDL